MPFFTCPIDITQVTAEEDICHFAGVRVRVKGSGNLDLKFLNLDQDVSETLVPLVMASGGGIQLFRLANFQSQGGFLRVSTDQLDEIFNINRIVILGKVLWVEYPA